MITFLIIFAIIQAIALCVLANENDRLNRDIYNLTYKYHNELSIASAKIINLNSHCKTLKSHYKKVIRELKKHNISKEVK